MTKELYEKLERIIRQLSSEECDKLSSYINQLHSEKEQAVAK